MCFLLLFACSGIATPAALKEAENILVDMGTYFQIQDDVLDCFGAPEVIGKVCVASSGRDGCTLTLPLSGRH